MKSSKSPFRFILGPLEKGDGPYSYRPSHRKILIAVGVLFAFLCGVLLYFASNTGGAAGYLIPLLVFGTVSAVTLIVGFLGSDRAVAKIWGQDKPGKN